MLAKKNKDIEKAYDLLTIMSKNEKARMAYEAREAEIHDQATREKTAKEEGILIGIKKGAAEKAIKVAQNLLKIGLSIEQTSSSTGISIEKVKEIQKNLMN